VLFSSLTFFSRLETTTVSSIYSWIWMSRHYDDHMQIREATATMSTLKTYIDVEVAKLRGIQKRAADNCSENPGNSTYKERCAIIDDTMREFEVRWAEIESEKQVFLTMWRSRSRMTSIYRCAIAAKSLLARVREIHEDIVRWVRYMSEI
jgi:hypothetical protein